MIIGKMAMIKQFKNDIKMYLETISKSKNLFSVIFPLSIYTWLVWLPVSTHSTKNIIWCQTCHNEVLVCLYMWKNNNTVFSESVPHTKHCKSCAWGTLRHFHEALKALLSCFFLLFKGWASLWSLCALPVCEDHVCWTSL